MLRELDPAVIEDFMNKEALEDDGRRYKVKGIISENSQRVTGGVPYFIINGRPVFSGARGPEVFHEVFNMLL